MRLSILAAVIVCIIGGVVLWRNSGKDRSETPPGKRAGNSIALEELPEPAPLESRYLNATPEAEYVGNDTCADCHTEEHASYLLSAHAAALRPTDAGSEPEDTEFYHAPSGRWYQVYRQDDQFRHRELVRDGQGGEGVLHDERVHWTMGSGRFSLSYLIEKEGFLIESPVTWYASRKTWEMSPGFDLPQHGGFERLADQGCLICHAGQVTPRNGNGYQPVINQTSIGCESCHGPGSLHVKWRSGATTVRGEDWTIVNPAKLERNLAESVCASCHLRGEATVYLRGRTMNDFRPGLALTDLRLDYGIKANREEMEVVGHTEQMRMSRCYTQSQTLTCMSCHNPHKHPSPEERLEYYRQACLECHTSDSCGLTLAERHQTDRTDNCVACHMPQTDTDIPHFAFTHHRIGIHTERTDSDMPEPAQSTAPRELVPYQIPPQLPPAERDRALGLAYLEYAPKHPEAYVFYLEAARKRLESCAKDGEALAALAVIDFQLRRPTAVEWAEAALSDQKLSGRSRVNALVVRASLALEDGNPGLAVRDLREATRLRRMADYWFLLSQALRQNNELDESIKALERAVEIAPQRIDFRERLSDWYRGARRNADADAQEQVIAVLKASASGSGGQSPK